jgi:hypothetical protein
MFEAERREISRHGTFTSNQCLGHRQNLQKTLRCSDENWLSRAGSNAIELLLQGSDMKVQRETLQMPLVRHRTSDTGQYRA